MDSLFPMSDQDIFMKRNKLHGGAVYGDMALPPRGDGGQSMKTARLLTETPRLLTSQQQAMPDVNQCCNCLRYCNTIAVSALVSAGIGILDPARKVEPVQLATLLLTRPFRVSADSLLKKSPSQAAASVQTDSMLSAPGHLRHSSSSYKRNFAASDFMFDSFLSTAPRSPVKRASSALACVDEEAELPRRGGLRRTWETACRLALNRPPGLSVFHNPDDLCSCACHCLTAKYEVDELLHSGYTSTVFACRRLAVVNPELFMRCYGHIASPPGLGDTGPMPAKASLAVSDALMGGIVPLTEDAGSSTADSPTVGGHCKMLDPKQQFLRNEPHCQAVRSACSWLFPIQTCDEIVIKIIHKNRCGRDELDRCLQEAKFLSVLHHRNIAKILASFDGTNELWMFFERATYTDLEDATTGKTYDEATVKHLVAQVLLALQYVHKRRIIHCDVKPKNILLYNTDSFGLQVRDRKFKGNDWSNIQLRLGDFGLAQSVPVERNNIKFDGVRGSHGFFAPEVLLRRDYDFKIDVWAVGIMTFMLLVGYEPFYPPSKCIQEEVSFEARYWDSISTEARDFVSRLLTFDPRLRASADEALAHPWLSLCSTRLIDSSHYPSLTTPGL
eukprot:Gregarina_sp_Poly_1__1631@NODE_1415_length_4199_cov_275_655615_g943_i0_p2_GENE_NODE_1415_length_4199_cov_275_655615_g943_i0NODE_1415_length_4199_cov_275_655615_g943_i0_p2_ORF_typecomplete_len615_score83_85Pkinase/PF00069_25/4_7e54Pkinase_Tyr/PF07714_17/1_9e31Kinaselike/PF14531_6/0_024Kinaselike/PF14531_6/0_00036Pkinase_fungal/PF17667_1/7_9e03Pkinase_fungal/PF17667_1/5_3e08Kdo/PF06293_14/6_1e07Pox_serthr_kin/PF05445_11/4_4e05RIO1/PF01163_22/0_003YrbLPhoP_reg/PF10707_9/0_068WaaY/PF06176_11/0_097_N